MTPQDTLARLSEIEAQAEQEIKWEMQVIAEAHILAVSPVGARRRLPVLRSIPALLALVRAQQEEIDALRKALHQCLACLHYPANGAHYCRSCRAGTDNNWVHDDYCTINNQCMSIDVARSVALDALRKRIEEVL